MGEDRRRKERNGKADLRSHSMPEVWGGMELRVAKTEEKKKRSIRRRKACGGIEYDRGPA